LFEVINLFPASGFAELLLMRAPVLAGIITETRFVSIAARNRAWLPAFIAAAICDISPWLIDEDG